MYFFSIYAWVIGGCVLLVFSIIYNQSSYREVISPGRGGHNAQRSLSHESIQRMHGDGIFVMFIKNIGKK